MNLNPHEIADVIQNLVNNSIDKVTNRTYKRGVVATVSGQKASVYIEGNSVATKGILSVGSYIPKINDKVLILSIGESGTNLVILGSLGTTETLNTWLTPTYANGWGDFGDANYGGVRYRKSSNGTVMFKGLVSGGTATDGTVMFNVPAGYRPGVVWTQVILTNQVAGRIDIDPAGNCLFKIGSNNWISLDGVTYIAEN